MDAHEGRGPTAVRQGHPRRQVHIHFTGAGQAHVHAPRPQKVGHLKRHIQNHVGLAQTADADGPRIRPPMTGVDHDAIAVAGHGGQPGRIHRRAGGTESTRWEPGRGTTAEVAFTEIIQAPGGQACEHQFPTVRSGSTQAQIVGVEIHIRAEFHHQTGGTRAGFAQPDLTDGTASRQAPRESQLTWNINPDPGAAAIAGGLKKRLQASVPAGAQLEHPLLGEGPGGQGTRGSGRQRLGEGRALQGCGQKPGHPSGRGRSHGAQNSVGWRCRRLGI